MFEGCGSSLSSTLSNTSSDSICDVGAVGIYRSNICPVENFEKIYDFCKVNVDNLRETNYEKANVYSVPFVEPTLPEGYTPYYRVFGVDPCFFDCTIPDINLWEEHANSNECMCLFCYLFQVAVVTLSHGAYTLSFLLQDDKELYSGDFLDEEAVLSYYTRDPRFYSNAISPFHDEASDLEEATTEEVAVVRHQLYEALKEGIESNYRPFVYPQISSID